MFKCSPLGLFLESLFYASLLCPSACDLKIDQCAILIDASFPKMHLEDRGEGRLAGGVTSKNAHVHLLDFLKGGTHVLARLAVQESRSALTIKWRLVCFAEYQNGFQS